MAAPLCSTAFSTLVGLSGFEPLTSPLSGARSSQLSYRPIYNTKGDGKAGAVRKSLASTLRAAPKTVSRGRFSFYYARTPGALESGSYCYGASDGLIQSLERR